MGMNSRGNFGEVKAGFRFVTERTQLVTAVEPSSPASSLARGLGQGLKALLNFCRMDGPTEVVPLLQNFGVLGAAEAVAT